MKSLLKLLAVLSLTAALAAPAAATPPYLYKIETRKTEYFVAVHEDPITTTIFTVTRPATASPVCNAAELFNLANSETNAPNMQPFSALQTMVAGLKPKDRLILRYMPCKQLTTYNVSTGVLCAGYYPKALGYELCSPVELKLDEKIKNWF